MWWCGGWREALAYWLTPSPSFPRSPIELVTEPGLAPKSLVNLLLKCHWNVIIKNRDCEPEEVLLAAFLGPKLKRGQVFGACWKQVVPRKSFMPEGCQDKPEPSIIYSFLYRWMKLRSESDELGNPHLSMRIKESLVPDAIGEDENCQLNPFAKNQ